MPDTLIIIKRRIILERIHHYQKQKLRCIRNGDKRMEIFFAAKESVYHELLEEGNEIAALREEVEFNKN